MSDKSPALQFYPGDWRKDSAVQSLSYHDRGVWFEMLMLMHGSEVRGKLILNGKPIPEDALCRLLGLDKQTLNQTITTLLDFGVASRCEETGNLRRLSRIKRTKDESAPLSTLITARPGSSMWIAPPAGVATSSVSLPSSPELATVTGMSAILGSLSSPRSNPRRHLKTWFAFTPCARATSATLAPGFSVNCTI
jgi:hypothetical protein